MQWLAHGKLAPNNIWAIPTCFLVPALSALFVILARRHGAFTPSGKAQAPAAQDTVAAGR